MTVIYYGFPQYLQASTEVYLDKVTTTSVKIFPCSALTQRRV